MCLLQQSKYKVINKDQWCNVLEFSRLIDTDLSNYDEDGACEWGILTLTFLVPVALAVWHLEYGFGNENIIIWNEVGHKVIS